MVYEQKEIKVCFFNIKTPSEDSILAPIILKKLSGLLSRYNITYNSVIETFHTEVLKKMKKEFPGFNYSLDEESNFGLVLKPWRFSGVKAAIHHGNKFAIAFRPRKITIANWTTYRRIISYDVKLRYRYNKKNPDSKISYLIGGQSTRKKSSIA